MFNGTVPQLGAHHYKVEAGKLTKAILKANGNGGAFTETPDEMVRRVCREFGNKKNIVVLNDEAHHCYRRKPDEEAEEEEKLTGEDRKEAEKRNKEARVWISTMMKLIRFSSITGLSSIRFASS